MNMTIARTGGALCATALAFSGATLASPAQTRAVRVALEYRAPGDGKPAPNFSPKGTQIRLTEVPASRTLPTGAVRPARSGVIEVGSSKASAVSVLATASVEHPADLCQLFIDRNRNGDFGDDGPALTAAPSQNAKTKAWWTSINRVELSVPYGNGVVEPYLVNFWIVREEAAPPPDILRYSVGSWRQGTVTVDGIEAHVAVMDSDNNAIFAKADSWSAMAAAEPNAARAVLTLTEARPMNRLMFLQAPGKTVVLEVRSIGADGRSLDVAVIDKNITKAADRAPDDMVREERARPRAQVPVEWAHGAAGLTAALARAKAAGKRVFIDFETTWCGPCHTMDEWIWTDAGVAAALNAGYVSVKLDGDVEKAQVKHYGVKAYPTMVVADPASGNAIRTALGYQSSKEILAFLQSSK